MCIVYDMDETNDFLLSMEIIIICQRFCAFDCDFRCFDFFDTLRFYMDFFLGVIHTTIALTFVSMFNLRYGNNKIETRTTVVEIHLSMLSAFWHPMVYAVDIVYEIRWIFNIHIVGIEVNRILIFNCTSFRIVDMWVCMWLIAYCVWMYIWSWRWRWIHYTFIMWW